jgi:agmatine deiminase
MIKRANILALLIAAGLLPVAASGQVRDFYPEGRSTPKYMTLEEALRWSPPALPRSGSPPTGPIWCPSEYEPMDGILIAWEGSTTQNNVLLDIARHVTGPHGKANIYVSVDTVSEQNSVTTTLANGGVDMTRVKFIVTTTDTIWIRDYGPRYIYQGDVRSIIDHTYNRPRPNDNLFPTAFSGYKKHARYEIPLIHGGGNFHNNSMGTGLVTRLINQENPSLTESQIGALWWDYQRLSMRFYNRFPTSVDSTGHIDMWMQVIGDKRVIISEWPNNPGSTQAIICENAAAGLAADGWTVYRTPAILSGGVHYTYTNSVICNDVVMVPSFTGFTGSSTRNGEAQAVFQQAFPGKQVVMVNAQPLITAAGALHCVTMHVPAPIGGVNPTAHILEPVEAQVYNPSDPAELPKVRWLSDDDKGVKDVDILLSADNGQTFPYTLASAIPDSGSLTITNTPVRHSVWCRVKIRVRDHDGNVGEYVSDRFVIASRGSRT